MTSMSIKNNYPYTYLAKASNGNYVAYPLIQPAQQTVRENSNNLAFQVDERLLSLEEKPDGTPVKSEYAFKVEKDLAKTFLEVRYTYEVNTEVMETRSCRLKIEDHIAPPVDEHLRPHLYLRNPDDGLFYMHIALCARDGHRYKFHDLSILDKGMVANRQLHIQEIADPGKSAELVELSLEGYEGDLNDETTVFVYETGNSDFSKAKGVVRHSNADNKPF
jgi:hypothetical protein